MFTLWAAALSADKKDMFAMTVRELNAPPVSGMSATMTIPAGEPVRVEQDATWLELGRALLWWRGSSWLADAAEVDERLTPLLVIGDRTTLRSAPPALRPRFGQ